MLGTSELPRQETDTPQVTRLRHRVSVTRLDPEFAEKFLAFVIREVIRHHESAPR
jgi:chorismate mutase